MATTCLPSVATDGFACVAFGCLLTFGIPLAAVRCQRIFPVGFSTQRSTQSCLPASFEESPSPYAPTFSSGFFSSLIAVVRKIRSPQMTGLEWPRPGMAVFHLTLEDFSTSQEVAVGKPSATPEAFGPRNCGQFPSEGLVFDRINRIGRISGIIRTPG